MTPHEAWTAALAAAARAADDEREPDGAMPSWPPEWSVEDVVRAAIRATRTNISRRISALPPPPDLAEPRASEEFRRGQADMREQAARECERLVGVHEFTEIDVTATQNDLRRAHARRIRALPLAEPAESQRAATCERCGGDRFIWDPISADTFDCAACGGTGERR